MSVIIAILIIIGITIAAFYALYKYKNKRLEPDYYEYYKNHDTVPVGQVGIFVTGMIMAETLDPKFYYNVTMNIFNTYIPWPFRLFTQIDRGIALLDPVKHHEEEEFVPTKLEDPFGNDRNIDSEPYIEKYKKGQVKWVPPSKKLHLDQGYFVYTKRKGGMPTTIGKIINRARLWDYGGFKQGKIPYLKESLKIFEGAFAKTKEKYGNIECYAENSFSYYDAKTKLHKLLDSGCDTIVLASPMIIYSHFEEFNSSFRHSFEYIEEWKREHPGKKIKVIFAPQMGDFQPMRQAFLEMLKDRLDTLPEGSDVTVVVALHGMPWEFFKGESWLEMAPPYRDRLHDEVKQLLGRYKFKRTNTVVSQDEFANPTFDPKEKYLSTNRAYKDAIRDGYDFVITLPIEYFAESPDTLQQHAQENYHGLDAYDVYEEIDYPDWSVPYVQEIKQGNTTIIYNGLPVGKYQHYVVEALFQSLDSVLSQGK